MPAPDIDAAASFLAAAARVVDRRRFERLFAGGGAWPVRDAVAAYRNDDGGFGHALEPDSRGPESQPAAVAQALRMLHEADAWDAKLVAGACDWLGRTAPREGGAVSVDSAVERWPHAPWWRAEAGRPASLATTGQIAGTLHARGMSHPWLERATALVWERIEGLDHAGAYELLGVLAFLDHVTDRPRAESAVERVGPLVLAAAEIDPDAEGEVHNPLAFAPEPRSVARRLFEETTIASHLDRLAAGQRDDGGWTFNWPAWSPAAEREWRGCVTVDALRRLRANGRL
jgi:hypothetical protein